MTLMPTLGTARFPAAGRSSARDLLRAVQLRIVSAPLDIQQAMVPRGESVTDTTEIHQNGNAPVGHLRTIWDVLRDLAAFFLGGGPLSFLSSFITEDV